ncbi:MAG: DUF4249 family protein [Syntrophomonadaceae bacterium]
MKKILFSILLCSSAFISSGCKDENFNPKGEFKEKYILTCILRSDTTVQTAVLSTSYNIQGYDPLENKTDPALDNADIRIWVGDSVYIMKSGQIPRADSSRYSTPVKYFYVENVKLPSNRQAEILAVLPNGRKLHATTQIPKPVLPDYTAEEQEIPPAGRNYVIAGWQRALNPNTFYYPRFSLIYFRLENGVPVRYLRKLPVRYFNSGGKFVPVYATPTNTASYLIDMDAINRTMRDISEGDMNKQNYVVLTVMAEIMTMDDNLSAYYSSLKLADNGFSVKLDQTDFTNIEGGLGVFGSFANTKIVILMDPAYIKSFGYKSKLGPE